jgi:putative lipoic acid-binding regulatory protein
MWAKALLSTFGISVLLSRGSVVYPFAPPRSAFVGKRRRMTLAPSREHSELVLNAAKAGSFFNQVESNDDNDDEEEDSDQTTNRENQEKGIQSEFSELLRRRKGGSLRAKPTGTGFATQTIQPPPDSGNKPFVGIGPPLNDVTRPEYDDEGYTLYADERTGKRSRVFEALVEYPCDFTLKIVGANEGQFVSDIVQLVAESCEVSVDSLSGKWTSRLNGKWTSVTVQAPVQSADMLYSLYQTIDRDPRVKFKF